MAWTAELLRPPQKDDHIQLDYYRYWIHTVGDYGDYHHEFLAGEKNIVKGSQRAALLYAIGSSQINALHSALESRNSWRMAHGLPPARPRHFHSSATETALRRSTSSTPVAVNGGDFESGISPWTLSDIRYAATLSEPSFAHTGRGSGAIKSHGWLASTITGLEPTKVYTLSFWYKLFSSVSPGGSCTISALVDNVPVASDVQDSSVDGPTLGWKMSPCTTGDLDVFLDDVVVTPFTTV
ncbi:hypothetical protein DL96DRAFT_1685333 [Flagelloscypha sp. PMI_526]|nr:hypothetical protein DL96DRAFT_1685333 [Flagelloscypha sp. PMI_526]